ncbi:hypothetical protein GCM10009676_41710 [Prauserella halophila]|uniref:Uncharacterized protein n=1 Tax=Prauserella halophila TaxID=185641 RepID=A0ABP4H4X3_9PSEU|nr:hypothetical protein [Prauserella halophila]
MPDLACVRIPVVGVVVARFAPLSFSTPPVSTARFLAARFLAARFLAASFVTARLSIAGFGTARFATARFATALFGVALFGVSGFPAMGVGAVRVDGTRIGPGPLRRVTRPLHGVIPLGCCRPPWPRRSSRPAPFGWPARLSVQRVPHQLGVKLGSG